MCCRTSSVAVSNRKEVIFHQKERTTTRSPKGSNLYHQRNQALSANATLRNMTKAPFQSSYKILRSIRTLMAALLLQDSLSSVAKYQAQMKRAPKKKGNLPFRCNLTRFSLFRKRMTKQQISYIEGRPKTIWVWLQPPQSKLDLVKGLISWLCPLNNYLCSLHAGSHIVVFQGFPRKLRITRGCAVT